MTALPAGQVQVALALVARRDGEALRGAGRAVLHARHVMVARQLERWHIEEGREPRQRCRQRMADAHHVARAPGAIGELGTALAEIGERDVHLRAQERGPVGIGAGEEVQRLRADQLPQGTLELRRRGAALLRRQAQSRENHVPYGLLGAVVIGAHQAVADRVDPGAGIPVLDQPPEFGTARVIEHGLGIEHAQQEGAPAAEEQRAVIELDAEHVRGRHVAVQRDEVVADLRGARAEVVLRAEGRELSADQLLLTLIDRHAGVRGPDSPQRRIDDPRVIGRAGPGTDAAGASGSGIRRNAAEDGPADVTPGVADHGVLVRDAHIRGEREGLLDGSRLLERQESEVGRRRLLRQPRAEPASVLGLVHAQQHALGSRFHLQGHGGDAPHSNLFPHHRERHGAVPARERPGADPRAGKAADTEPGAVAVGEAPGDVPVRSGHEHRRSGQCDPVEIDGRRAAPRDEHEPRVIPDGRYPLPEMHVVGDERGARRGQRARNRPAVAARRPGTQRDPGRGRRRWTSAHVEHLP